MGSSLWLRIGRSLAWWRERAELQLAASALADADVAGRFAHAVRADLLSRLGDAAGAANAELSGARHFARPLE